MSALRLSRSLTLLPFLAGCSSSGPPPVCGESFCLPKDAKLLSRESPVEDFNLYRVEADGQRFLIYEGNSPRREAGSIVLTMEEKWPAYLEVSGPCSNEKSCAVKSFTAKLSRR